MFLAGYNFTVTFSSPKQIERNANGVDVKLSKYNYGVIKLSLNKGVWGVHLKVGQKHLPDLIMPLFTCCLLSM